MTSNKNSQFIVGIRFVEIEPLKFFQPDEQDLEIGDWVLIDDGNGPTKGQVAISSDQVLLSELTCPIKGIFTKLDNESVTKEQP
mgnify:FL=1|jgi:hypothetical protein